MRLPNLTDQDVKLAESLYKEFFSTCGQDNPTDINTAEKKRFFNKYGVDALVVMQRCRKKGSEVYPFTKRDK
jgi:hypothetical protein